MIDELWFGAALDDYRIGVGPDPRPRRRIRQRMPPLPLHARCRLCGAGGDLERHHIVPRSQGGDDVACNLMPLCGPLANACHLRVTRNDPATLRAVRAALFPEEVDYVLARKGEAWLDRRYPAA